MQENIFVKFKHPHIQIFLLYSSDKTDKFCSRISTPASDLYRFFSKNTFIVRCMLHFSDSTIDHSSFCIVNLYANLWLLFYYAGTILCFSCRITTRFQMNTKCRLSDCYGLDIHKYTKKRMLTSN